MTQSDVLRQRVQDFYSKHAIGTTAADAFPAWWLHRKFELSPADAIRCCSNGSGDYGLDAFHFEEGTEHKSILHLVQAKFSASRVAIKKAILGFDRVMVHVGTLLESRPLEETTANPILTRLAAELQRRQGATFGVQFSVIHLCEEDDEALHVGLRSTLDRFEARAAELLRESTVRLKLIGPSQMDVTPTVGHTPASAWKIRFSGVPLQTRTSAKYFSGLGRLADLVNLYKSYGDYLFSKNVRQFLLKERERGPAKYMRDTLRAICAAPSGKAMPAERFPMYHNGVTLYAEQAELIDGVLTVRKPSVLNGCQSVKNAYLFSEDPHIKGNIDRGAWDDIHVPLRVLVTADEDFVRRVAVNNNRQTALRPSAFRANDPVQLRLGERLRERRIFYERQEGAFDNYKLSHPKELEEEYNDAEAALTMEELAQAIATVGDRPLSVASKVSDLFDDAMYDRVFSVRNLKSLELLAFLRNVLKVIHLALKDVRENSSRLEDLPIGRFRFPATRILARYVVKHAPQLVEVHGGSIVGRAGPRHPLRLELVRLMNANNSRLQQLLPDVWRDKESGWQNAMDRDRIDKALRLMRLDKVDVFAAYE